MVFNEPPVEQQAMKEPESNTGEAIEDGFHVTTKQTLSFSAMMSLSLMAALDGSSISVTLPVSAPPQGFSLVMLTL
jgi:hypothetical protein